MRLRPDVDEDRFLLREFLIDEETGLGKEEEQL